MEKAASRLKVLAVLIAFMFAAISIRLWFLQVLAVAQARDEARANSVRIVETDALRGNIYWDDGKTPLVDNRPSLEVRVNRQDLQASGQADAVLYRLAKVLGLKVAGIRRSLHDPRYYPYQPKPVAEFVPETVYAAIKEHPERFPGVQVVPTSVRNYPDGSTAAHVVGYLGQIDKQQLHDPAYAGYGASDLVGKAGLELTYEKYLRGTKGKQKFIVNSSGDPVRTLGAIPPTKGDNLVLALDPQIQKAAQEELLNGLKRAHSQIDEAGGGNYLLKAPAGAVVVMDVHTGGILAMASWPSYNPSWFVKGLTPQQEHYLGYCGSRCPQASMRAVQLNRAMQQNYKPGSTFKPFVGLAAVKEGLTTLGSYTPCPAVYYAQTDVHQLTPFTNWSAVDLAPMSLHDALRTSCDTVFNQFGDEFYLRWRQNPLGDDNEPFQRDLRQWGYGKVTGVDLPGEAAGLIPDAAFAKANPATYPYGMVPGLDILLAIGSGDTLATPLQMATAYSAIANGGELCTPHIVDRITDARNKTVKTISGHCAAHRMPYSQPDLQYIRDALSTVPISGTATSAFAGFPLSQYPVAGKTGTAERQGTNPDGTPLQSTSWFASFAPANHPKYAVVAMVEQGGYGSQTAAPIVRHMYEHLFGLQVTSTTSSQGAD